MSKNLKLYHGSSNQFEEFNLDELGKNGTAQGFGIYLTPNVEMAEMYMSLPVADEEIEGYIYTTSVQLENTLSLDKVSLTDEQLSNIIDKLHEEHSYLDNYGDISYSGYESVKAEALELILDSNDNDVDIMNDIANSLGDNLAVAEIFYSEGKFTHALAHEQTIKEDDVYIVFNPEQVNIEKISTVSNKDHNLEVALNCSLEEKYYYRACELYSNENELFKILEDNEVELLRDNDVLVFDSFKELFEKQYEDSFKKSLELNYIEDLKNELGKNCFNHLLEQNKELYQKVTKELDLDNDGVPDRVDFDDNRNSVSTVSDLDEVKNNTRKEQSKQRDYDELER